MQRKTTTAVVVFFADNLSRLCAARKDFRGECHHSDRQRGPAE